MDKGKALDAAMIQIERQFGKGSIMRMGAHASASDIQVVPTGSLALDLPAEVRHAVADWQRAHLEPVAELRVNHALHVTLCFLGNVAATQATPIAAALAQISFAPIQSALGEPLFLPPRGGSRRVVALALADESGRLSTLQAEVSAALAGLGVYEAPKRPYVAHLTVARYRHPGPALSLQNVNVPAFGLDQMTLYDSVLERVGAVHTPLAVFPAIYERSPSG